MGNKTEIWQNCFQACGKSNVLNKIGLKYMETFREGKQNAKSYFVCAEIFIHFCHDC